MVGQAQDPRRIRDVESERLVNGPVTYRLSLSHEFYHDGKDVGGRDRNPRHVVTHPMLRSSSKSRFINTQPVVHAVITVQTYSCEGECCRVSKQLHSCIERVREVSIHTC